MFERLRLRIQKDLGLELTNFRRTYAGRHMKSSGAFVWTAQDIKSNCTYGSGENATNLVNRSEKLGIVEELRIGQTQFEIS